MTSEYRKTVAKLSENADGVRNPDGSLAVYGACSECQDQHNVRVLAEYGTRCKRCFERYCAEPQPTPPVVDKNRFGRRAWARSLQQRDIAGAPLSPFQRNAYRAVLNRVKGGQDVPAKEIDAALVESGDLTAGAER